MCGYSTLYRRYSCTDMMVSVMPDPHWPSKWLVGKSSSLILRNFVGQRYITSYLDIMINFISTSWANRITNKPILHNLWCRWKNLIYILYSNTHVPHAWILPPMPAHAEAERSEEKSKGQVCRRAWTRYGRTNQRVVPAAGQKDLSTRIWWVMYAINNSRKHYSELANTSLEYLLHQIACV